MVLSITSRTKKKLILKLKKAKSNFAQHVIRPQQQSKEQIRKKKEKERAGEKERKKNRKEVKKNRKTDSKEMCKTFLVFFLTQ